MTDALRNALTSVVGPLLRRPKRLQVAAICYRSESAGKKVLLITSRDSRRWVVPKGWPMDGYDAPGAAMQEAWEEAGVVEGNINREPVGTYDYDKQLDNGAEVPVETTVFTVEVKRLEDEFPEASERERKWVSPQEAAQLVEEPGLQEILRQL
ncbi:8-oxo-dGTP pyrophosphatase MutT, NUDIX family [Shimia gijangensis]|uniref:8-oxo-dGTP pyrophosphatase MutT, NUDIX family n=1 Tax=Shimia gijangensis TaxID=1470563 RepID=A0A1M6IB24_9RHOB|nr:NUDIX hydrolase [Shimia gijangensis]SHJ31635.1 8-oxo-dGTP pyrophosphatase MutT, NUDIX family [Shimia gijangensis]